MSLDISVRAPGLWRRLASLFYEFILLFGVLLLGLVFPHVLLGVLTHWAASAPVLWAHLFLLLLVYCVGFWCYGGQTLAMKTWRIRVLARDGTRLRLWQALWRYLLCWPSLLCGGIGIFWALVDRDGQFLHDRLAGTRLVDVSKP